MRWTMRVLLVLSAALAVMQPTSIGQYLDGRYAMLGMHSTCGTALMGTTFLLGLAAIVYALVGGRVWVLAASVVLFFAVTVQLGLGYSKSLAVHIPLGVAIVAGTVALAIWSWTPAARRFRPRRADR